jgi:hypothetical protein
MKFIQFAAVAIAFWFIGSAMTADQQPYMKGAMQNLKDAKDNLEKARGDKGGHRLKALEHVNAAIIQTQKGIEFDNQH